jgi:copper chaperone
MKELKFKTNIKCSACEEAVAPKLDSIANTQWDVDLKHPDRILIVKGDEVKDQQVIQALEEAGYKGEPI